MPNFYLPWSVKTYCSPHEANIACTIRNNQGDLIASVPDYQVAEYIVNQQTTIDELEERVVELEIDLEQPNEPIDRTLPRRQD